MKKLILTLFMVVFLSFGEGRAALRDVRVQGSILNAGAMCRMLNKKQDEYGLECSTTSNWKNAIDSLKNGETDFIFIEPEEAKKNNLLVLFSFPKDSVMATEKMDDETAYKITKAFYNAFPVFVKRHPSFKNSDASDMPKVGGAKLHPGAVKFYHESSL